MFGPFQRLNNYFFRSVRPKSWYHLRPYTDQIRNWLVAFLYHLIISFRWYVLNVSNFDELPIKLGSSICFINKLSANSRQLYCSAMLWSLNVTGWITIWRKYGEIVVLLRKWVCFDCLIRFFLLLLYNQRKKPQLHESIGFKTFQEITCQFVRLPNVAIMVMIKKKAKRKLNWKTFCLCRASV